MDMSLTEASHLFNGHRYSQQSWLLLAFAELIFLTQRDM
jgi:hypothetical protein